MRLAKSLIIFILLCLFLSMPSHALRIKSVTTGTCNAPCLNAFEVVNILFTQATGTWTTVQSTTNNRILVGTDTNYGMAPVDCGASADTSHSCDITSLTANTNYHASACSTYSSVEHCSPDVPFKTEAFPEALVASYIFDAQTGVDSVNGYNITLSGTATPTYVNTVSQTCSSYGVSFPGTGSGVGTASGTKLNNFSALTIDFTLYCTSYGASGYGRVLSIGTGTNNDKFYILTNSQHNDIGVGATDAQGNSYFTDTYNATTPVLSLNQRQSYRVKYDPSGAVLGDTKFHIYKDVAGSYVEQTYFAQPAVPNILAQADTWNWGNNSTGTRSLGCVLDNVRVYNTVNAGVIAATPPTCDNNPAVSETTSPADAPTIPADNRIIYVDNHAGCNDTNLGTDVNNPKCTIQSAVSNSQPGDSIKVKVGLTAYARPQITGKDCTKALPCTLEAYDPAARANNTTGKPLIDSNYGSPGGNFKMDSKWWILDGFEIKRDTVACINLENANVTIRHNYIHHCQAQSGSGGIIVAWVSASSIAAYDDYIVDNTIDHVGTYENIYSGYGCLFWTAGFCGANPIPCSLPKFCHGIYIANHAAPCLGNKRIVIRRNKVSNTGGSGIQANSDSCSEAGSNHNISDVLIDTNEFRVVQKGLNLTNINNFTIRNNTFIMDVAPPQSPIDQTTRWVISTYLAGTVLVYNNIFQSSSAIVMPWYDWGASAPIALTSNYNLWNTTDQTWFWANSSKSSFNTNFKSATPPYPNQEANGVMGSAAGFVSTSDAHLSSTASPAYNTGTNAQCPVFDFDLIARPQAVTCDMGEFEFH